MNKYFRVAKLTWDETFIYRLNFVMWRARSILQILTLYFLWASLIPSGTSIFGYNQTSMLTYILGTSLVSSIVLSSRSHAVGDEINSGNLSNFLLRPINYFFYWFARDIGDKTMNIIFAIVELSLLFAILRPPLFIQTESLYLLLTFFAIILALIMYFLFNFLLGLIGFWSPEVWAPRFIFMILLNFFAGGLFPLDILPKFIFSFFQLLPFTYLLYFPIKIYLGQVTIIEIFTGITISLFWTMLLYMIVQYVWKKGLLIYTAQGR
ncbi:MAG: ABC-2 family transporter protein [Patescibacteria group bacterium]